jgi:putative tricarboxylic transport membrane protein
VLVLKQISIRNKKDLVLGILVVCLGAYIFQQSLTYPSPPTRDIGPSIFPQLIGIILVICGVVVMCGTVKLGSIAALQGEDKDATSYVKLIGIMLLSVLYVICLTVIGYWSATLLYLFLMLIIVSPEAKNVKLLLKMLAIALLATTIIYFAFGELLRVPLP